MTWSTLFLQEAVLAAVLNNVTQRVIPCVVTLLNNRQYFSNSDYCNNKSKCNSCSITTNRMLGSRLHLQPQPQLRHFRQLLLLLPLLLLLHLSLPLPVRRIVQRSATLSVLRRVVNPNLLRCLCIWRESNKWQWLVKDISWRLNVQTSNKII